ncbi:MAG: YidC/Oxa1 family membrane protein insertase [Clostridiales bacterium]|nr:YidC/Oxa1 family membrane protein insertase [Clostridiales bacterium]
MIQKDPGYIVGPIAQFMGWIIDFIFNVVYPFTEKNSLGISIIFLTIIVRFLMLPLAFKSQKSMMAMQKLAPEMDKLKKKYGDSKDPEVQKKMNVEMQALYARNKVNPLSGCLPLLIQMPIFFGLTYLMNQSFLYIGKLRDVYDKLAAAIYEVPHWSGMFMEFLGSHLPSNLKPPKGSFDLAPIVDSVSGSLNFSNFIKYLNRITVSEWDLLFYGNPAKPDVSSITAQASPQLLENIQSLYAQKQNIEMFFGLNMLDVAGWRWPGVLIPILTVITTFLTSWLSMQLTSKTNKDQSAVMQQRVMMFAMPLMMGFFTINYPIGVGIYWITSSIFQVVQQYLMNRQDGIRLSAPKEEGKNG